MRLTDDTISFNMYFSSNNRNCISDVGYDRRGRMKGKIEYTIEGNKKWSQYGPFKTEEMANEWYEYLVKEFPSLRFRIILKTTIKELIKSS